MSSWNRTHRGTFLVIAPGPALGLRFDIDKLGSSRYGFECWKVFWRSIDPDSLIGAVLYEGDTTSTLRGSENVFCIAVRYDDRVVLEKARAKLQRSADFQRLAASRSFIDKGDLAGEPLPEAGTIARGGGLAGEFWSRTALDAVRKQNGSALGNL